MNLATIIQIIQITAAIFANLPDVLLAIEKLFPEKGKGAEKLALAREMLQTAFVTLGGVRDAFEAVWPVINKAINARVAANNAEGVFSK